MVIAYINQIRNFLAGGTLAIHTYPMCSPTLVLECSYSEGISLVPEHSEKSPQVSDRRHFLVYSVNTGTSSVCVCVCVYTKIKYIHEYDKIQDSRAEISLNESKQLVFY